MAISGTVDAICRARIGFRNWKRVLLRIAAARVAGAPSDTHVVTREGTSVRCRNTPLGRAPIWEVFASDDFPWDLLVGGLRPGAPLIIDIGAHVGTFTLAMAARVPGLRAVCFEPSVATFTYLEANLRENQMQDRVDPRNRAISSTGGEISFWEAELGSCINSSTSFEGGRRTTVPSVTLSEVMTELGQEVDLLKVDCEGAEHEILPSLDAQTWTRVRSVFLEYHPNPAGTWAQLSANLKEKGFSIVWQRPALQGIDELGLAYLRRPST